eukprot:CAMPEP_0178386056 /NCGR_PEP_ID=MMETSP0689_2-20121128/8350_1 /TAXON_ID=160604 /ORGANISM="Amphidinium massartii, Strain CS-259" /LENGTH=137 /DNA_ID=CAMNT_0020006355 /DNA_START=42 /DNA_END=455 /DNA_ORIENTATION=+
MPLASSNRSLEASDSFSAASWLRTRITAAVRDAAARGAVALTLPKKHHHGGDAEGARHANPFCGHEDPRAQPCVQLLHKLRDHSKKHDQRGYDCHRDDNLPGTVEYAADRCQRHRVDEVRDRPSVHSRSMSPGEDAV